MTAHDPVDELLAGVSGNGTQPDQGTTPETPVDRHAASRIDWRALWRADLTAADWLLEPLIARGRGHALYAPGKAGKSLLGLEAAAALASGRTVLDQAAGDPVRVLYIDQEMTPDDLRERLDDMGYGPTVNLEPLAYYQLSALPPLDTAAGGADVLALATAHRADLVIIDTLGRVLDGEENSADTIRAYYRHTGAPLKARGIATLRLDHAGKNIEKGQRGTSAKADDVDLVWKLIPRDGDRLTLKATHRRIGWAPEVVDLERRSDPLRHVTVRGAWPPGTETLADQLDHLNVPVDAGRPTCRDALKNVGRTATTEVLAAAIRYRKARPETPPTLLDKELP